MTGSKTHKGFALLIAIVLSAIAAAVTVALTTLAYKSLILSASARDSQYAFYAADTALECALYGDKHNAHFPYDGSGTAYSCGDITLSSLSTSAPVGNVRTYTSNWFDIPGPGTTKYCGRITVYKANPTVSGLETTLFGEGVDVACTDFANPRATERGIRARYGT